MDLFERGAVLSKMLSKLCSTVAPRSLKTSTLAYSSSKLVAKKSSSGVLSEFAPTYPAVLHWELTKNNHVRKIKYNPEKPFGLPKVRPTKRRLDRVILGRKLVSRSKVKELFANGLVTIDGEVVASHSHIVPVNAVFAIDGVLSEPLVN